MKFKKNKIYKKILIIILIFAFFSFTSNILQYFDIEDHRIIKDAEERDLKNSAAYYMPGGQIYIDDLVPSLNWSKTAADNLWCYGSGTMGSPYIIENVIIDRQQISGSAIIIRDSNVYFRIVNCIIYNTTWDDAGIELISVSNGRLYDNNVTNCYYGIKLDSSNDNLITENTISGNNYYGVYVYSSWDNDILNNSITYNGVSGIFLYYGDYNSITNNTITDNDIGIDIWSQSDYNNVTGNIIDGDQFAVEIFSGDSNNIFENEIFGAARGINLRGLSLYNVIRNNDIYSNIYGIASGGNANYNNFSNNEIYDNSYGIASSGNIELNIEQNDLTNNTEYGISLNNVENCNITENTLTDCGFYLSGGISKLLSLHLPTSNLINGKPVYFYVNESGLNEDLTNAGQILIFYSNSSIFSNAILSKGSVGVLMISSNNNTLSNIESSHNSKDGIYLILSNNNTIIGCNISNNNGYGINLEDSHLNNISSSIANDNGVTGFFLITSSNTIVSDNTANNNTLHGIFIDGSSIWAGTTFSILGNTANYNNDTGIYIVGYEWNAYVKDCLISDNIVNYNGKVGMRLEYIFSSNIIENDASYNGGCGIHISGNDNNIFNNTANSNYEGDVAILWDHYGILFYGRSSTNNSFVDNVANYNEIGMFIVSHLTSSSTPLIAHNLIFRNTFNYNQQGLEFQYCNNLMIKENTMNYNSYAGLYMYQTNNNTIYDNDMINSRSRSVQCDYSKYNNFTGNTMKGHDTMAQYGMTFRNSHYNDFIDNYITIFLQYGFYFDDSSYNKVIRNTIKGEICFFERGDCIGNEFINNTCQEFYRGEPGFDTTIIMGVVVAGIVIGVTFGVHWYKEKRK